MLTSRSPQPCPAPTLYSLRQEKHLHLRNLLRVDRKKNAFQSWSGGGTGVQVGVQERSSSAALHIYSWGSWDQTLPSPLAKLLSRPCSGGQQCRCFYGQKALERAGHSPVCVPSLFLFTPVLLTLLHKRICASSFSLAPWLGMVGLLRLQGTLSKATSEQETRKALCSKTMVGRSSCSPGV